MKYTQTFAILASITGSAFAALRAPLPEFKNEKQLASWRAEKASKSGNRSITQDTAFYTGKPYLTSSGSYAFKYRSYDPEAIRWTSEDPSGFPDGANNLLYNVDPLSGCDSDGLLWRFVGSGRDGTTYNDPFSVGLGLDSHRYGNYEISGYHDGHANSLALTLACGTTSYGFFNHAAADLSVSLTFNINTTSGECTLSGVSKDSAKDDAITVGEVAVGYNVGYKDGVNVMQGVIAFDHGYAGHQGIEVGFGGEDLGVKVTMEGTSWSLPKDISFSLNKEQYE